MPRPTPVPLWSGPPSCACSARPPAPWPPPSASGRSWPSASHWPRGAPSTLLNLVAGTRRSFDAARRTAAQDLAPDFSPFQFVRTNEAGLSKLIGWLLDPAGSHGQGGRFLEAFVNWLGTSWTPADCAGASVRWEVPTHRLEAWNRRIDVLVTSGGKAIAIENKPWAADQPSQVASYLQHLEAGHPQSHSLLYLSGNGSEPGEESIANDAQGAARAAGRLYIKGYADLLSWLRDCRGRCRAERVRNFLDEFCHFIEKQFLGVRDVTERTELIEQISGSPETLRPALMLIHAGDALKMHLLRQLHQQLDQKARANGWTCAAYLEKSWPRYEIRYVPDADIRFVLEASSLRLEDVYFGVKYDRRNAVGAPALYTKLSGVMTGLFGKGRQNEAWPWQAAVSEDSGSLPVATNWRTGERPWLMIQSGQLAETVIAAAQKVHGALISAQLLPAPADQP